MIVILLIAMVVFAFFLLGNGDGPPTPGVLIPTPTVIVAT